MSALIHVVTMPEPIHNIRVYESTWEKLWDLKRKYRYRSMDELINDMIRVFVLVREGIKRRRTGKSA